MPKWEYMRAYLIPSEFDGYMRSLGSLGWELVTAMPTEYGRELYFKRRLPKEQDHG